jgi:hypothetical protein
MLYSSPGIISERVSMALNLSPTSDSVSIGTGLWRDPFGRSRPTARSFYICHFQGNYKENERVGQSSQLRPQYSADWRLTEEMISPGGWEGVLGGIGSVFRYIPAFSLASHQAR